MKLILAICLFTSFTSFSQRVRINGVEGDRFLTWDDFKGKPDKNSSLGAYTFWSLQNKSNGSSFKGDTLVWNLEIWVELGKDSWVNKDKETDTLLQHEQGHFNIGKLCATEIENRIKKTVLRKDYQIVINLIVKEIGDKYKAMEKRYDEETNHGKIREQQWKWNEFFIAELAKLTNR